MISPISSRSSHLAVAVILPLALLAACGSDEDAYCDAADQVEADVQALADLDLITEGTSGLSDRFEAIEESLDDLNDTGRDVAADEIDALNDAIDDLESATEALGDDGISVDNASAIVSAIAAVGSATGDVVTRLATACG